MALEPPFFDTFFTCGPKSRPWLHFCPLLVDFGASRAPFWPHLGPFLASFRSPCLPPTLQFWDHMMPEILEHFSLFWHHFGPLVCPQRFNFWTISCQKSWSISAYFGIISVPLFVPNASILGPYGARNLGGSISGTPLCFVFWSLFHPCSTPFILENERLA